MTEIVKVQVPIFSNAAGALPLVYAKGKRNQTMQPLDYATRKALGSDLKGYFEAEWSERQGQWLIGKRVAARDW